METQQTMTWLLYALISVCAWGTYGVLLHTGQLAMDDPIHGRYKAYLFVGIAYFITAVLGPLAILLWYQVPFTFTGSGMGWSLLAGTAGAIGAFGVLLAFGAKGSPSVVMSIIFAGAPILNAIIALTVHPPAGGVLNLRWQFVAGILLAAVGACMVTLYKPKPAPAKHFAQEEAPVQVTSTLLEEPQKLK